MRPHHCLPTLTLMLIGCGTASSPPMGTNAHDDAAAAEPGDAADPDVAITGDTVTADISGDSGRVGPRLDSASEDITSTGDTAPTDVEPTDTGLSCEALKASADEALSAAGEGCQAPTDCAWFEFPICGTVGCYQGAIRQDASTAEHEAINTPAIAAMHAGCAPFHCGCGWPEGTAVCLQGACRMCPGDCGESCTEVEHAIDAFAAQVASGCSSDDECLVLPVGTCSLGESVTCHGLPYREGQDTSALEALFGGAELAGCDTFQCDCQLTEAICEGGVCVAEM